MFLDMGLWTPFGLMILGVKESWGSDIHHHSPYHNISSYNLTTSELPPITVSSTSTITLRNCSSSGTTTSSVPPTITSSTLYSTTSSVPPTITSSTLYSTTTSVPSSYITTSSPVFDSCPTSCSIYAGTVDLFYWPTNNDYSYPSTYVDTALDYTFTSPSVYMVINTIYGYNTLGRAGPAASSPVFALNLGQVSTIVPGGQATRQLSLSDLGTDCPHTLDPSEIATKAPDGRCDPSLVAPDVVKSWALPCNACGRFGLFDPPYAVPTLDGGLLPTTTITTPEAQTTASATPTTTPAATGASSTAVEATTTTAIPPTTEPTSTPVTVSSSASSDPTTAVTASATRVASGLACLMLSFVVSISLM
ncbi:hypothetical protein F4779DRAFT_579506 [Xylariaceae sp. FL0662B]|nr:hypothetical protein F4779DRAFT_579506 [Xylariaceae sp. FL0662B]